LRSITHNFERLDGDGGQIEFQYIWKHGTPSEVAICMKGEGTSHMDIQLKAHLPEKRAKSARQRCRLTI